MTYSDEHLEKLLDDIESDRSERKETWKGDAPETGRQAICAFANDLPDHGRAGVLFVGAKDNGAPSGLIITDELLRTLSDIRSDGNILPQPSILVEKRTLKGAEMAVVTVRLRTLRPFDTKEGSGFAAVPGGPSPPPRKSAFSMKNVDPGIFHSIFSLYRRADWLS